MDPDDLRLDMLLNLIASAERRRILALLIQQPRTATELSGVLPISRQAVSRHLNLLVHGGLIEPRTLARRLVYDVTASSLEIARTYIDSVQRLSAPARLRLVQA